VARLAAVAGSTAPLSDERPIGVEVRAAFDRDGHTVVRGLLSADELSVYGPAIERAAHRHAWDKRPLDERDTYGKAFLQVPNLWEHDLLVREFVMARRFASVAAQLLGVDGVRLYHDQALFKEPGGGHTPWHQDQHYWPLDTDRTITMWMPLVDVPPEIGGMTFASGSHRLGDLGRWEIGDDSEEHFEQEVRSRSLPLAHHGPFTAGDATFHAGWTLHRAPANPTSTMRSVMTIIYFADGARVTEPDHAHRRMDLALWLRGRQPGDIADGDINPLLYRVDAG
jgi:hypothetical protein